MVTYMVANMGAAITSPLSVGRAILDSIRSVAGKLSGHGSIRSVTGKLSGYGSIADRPLVANWPLPGDGTVEKVPYRAARGGIAADTLTGPLAGSWLF